MKERSYLALSTQLHNSEARTSRARAETALSCPSNVGSAIGKSCLQATHLDILEISYEPVVLVQLSCTLTDVAKIQTAHAAAPAC